MGSMQQGEPPRLLPARLLQVAKLVELLLYLRHGLDCVVALGECAVQAHVLLERQGEHVLGCHVSRATGATAEPAAAGGWT